MSKTYKWTNWNGDKFEMTKEEYDFFERNDYWDGLSEMAHQWDLDNDPGTWDLMIETIIPFMTTEDTI
jgi:hypothetical protein